MKFAIIFLATLAPFTASASMLRARHMEAIASASFNIPEIGHERSLQGNVSIEDLQFVRLGDPDSTIKVLINETAASGLLTFGDALVAIGPPVSGAASEVTCTAVMDASGVDMQFYLRKALIPDEDGNGNAKEYDCAANQGDVNLIAPDTESCSVTNFNDIGDLVVGYVAVLDDGFAIGTEYTISFKCELTQTSVSCFCFSEDATVDVLGKGLVKMADLAVGDKVRTGESYESIYAFAHMDKTTSTSYLHISTDSPNAPLEVSKDHLVHVNGKFVAAKDVKVGDILMDGSHGKAKVKKITTKNKTGLYAPLTPSGTLLVNGIKTSAYVSLQKDSKDTLKLGDVDTYLSFHTLNHIALSPIRLACLGISSSFCSTDHISEETGYPPFVSFWFNLIQWFELQVLPFQVFLLALFFCVVGPIFVAESLLGASFGTVLFLVGAPVLARQYYNRNQHSPTSIKVKQL